MDGENHGSKPYEQMDDLGGKTQYFWNIQMNHLPIIQAFRAHEKFSWDALAKGSETQPLFLRPNLCWIFVLKFCGDEKWIAEIDVT